MLPRFPEKVTADMRTAAALLTVSVALLKTTPGPPIT